MKLRQLEISHFRGIETLSWQPGAGFNLLLGPGDSGKTTVLDALDLALGPRWNVSVSDADFYGCETSCPISITATVGELPKQLLGEPRFESHFRGWRVGQLHDEMEDDHEGQDEPVLSVRFSVNENLEPTWRIFTDREPENGPVVLAKDREILGVVRVAHYVDRHLNWGRGSALTQYTDEVDNLTPIFADVRRHTRAQFKNRELPKLSQAATDLGIGAKKLGVRLTDVLQPGLDLGALQSGAAAVALFDGDIPTRQLGLGSRRLLTITMQLGREGESSVLLLDELESALEPYRIRSLVAALVESGIQVIGTTHSPVVVEEAWKQSLFFCLRHGSSCQPVAIEEDVAQILKLHPATPLSKRVLICEGKTEIGFLTAAKIHWRGTHGAGFEVLGVGEVYAAGRTECGRVAKQLLKLGIPCAVFADSDEPINLSAQDRANPLLALAQYVEAMLSERALFESLDHEGHEVALAVIAGWNTALRTQLATRFEQGSNGKFLGVPLDSSRSVALHLAELAVEGSWIKDEHRAAAVLTAVLDRLAGPLQDVLTVLEGWCYGTGRG